MRLFSKIFIIFAFFTFFTLLNNSVLAQSCEGEFGQCGSSSECCAGMSCVPMDTGSQSWCRYSPPTSTPKPTTPPAACEGAGSQCGNGVTCCSPYSCTLDSNDTTYSCKFIPTPTAKPTNTPVPTTACEGQGSQCGNGVTCCGGLSCVLDSNDTTYSCQVVPTSTPKPTATPVACEGSGSQCGNGVTCCSPYSCALDSNDTTYSCQLVPTQVPTSCGDGKSVKIGGRVWQSIARDGATGQENYTKSKGAAEVDVIITRGDNKSITVKSGYEYSYNEATGQVKPVKKLYQKDGDVKAGEYLVCGFVADYSIDKFDAKAKFSVYVDRFSEGTTTLNPITVRPPEYKLQFDLREMILFTEDHFTANTREGLREYSNQFGDGGTSFNLTKSCNAAAILDPASNNAIRHRCDFLVEKTIVPEEDPGTETMFTGRVFTLGRSSHYWQNTEGKCGGNYPSAPQMRLKSERVTEGGTTDGEITFDHCNSNGPFYSSGKVLPGLRTLTLTNVPTGYRCTDWTYHRYNNQTNTWVDWKSQANATFNKEACSLTISMTQLNAPEENLHNIWFAIEEINTQPTLEPPGELTPQPTTEVSVGPTSSLPTMTVAPTSVPEPTTGAGTPVASPTFPPTTCNIKPIDIQLVIDRSSSMYSESLGLTRGRTRLEWAKDAAIQFIDRFTATNVAKQGDVRIGFTSYAGKKASTLQTSYEPTTNFELIKDSIKNMKLPDDGSCLECGLQVAREELESIAAGGANQPEQIIVFLSDGRGTKMINARDLNGDSKINNIDTDLAGIQEAALGKQRGITYYVVGFDSKREPIRLATLIGDNDPQTSYPTEGIANKPDTSFFRADPDPLDWPGLFNRVKEDICINSLFKIDPQ